MNFDDLQDEICGWCGKGFTGIRYDQKYCCIECQRRSQSAFKTAVASEERRRQRIGMTCQRCAAPLDADRRDQKWCSVACTMAAYHDRQRGFCRVPGHCIHCDKLIVGRRPQALYCSTSCQGKHVYQRAKARGADWCFRYQKDQTSL